MSTTEQSRKFLDPKTVSLISNYRLRVRLIVDGFFVGHHRGPRHAFSLEFGKHREYYPGDPLKLVDWKLYGKTDRFFIKQFEEETNLESWMVLDMSRSMSYQGTEGSVSKIQYASHLAGALSYLLLGQKDLVGLLLFDSKPRKILPPSSASRQLFLILKELKNIKLGGVSNWEEAGRHAASRIRRRGLVVLFSDFLADPLEVEQVLKSYLHKGNEVIAFHLLTPEELRFPFARFGYFEDLETQQKILLQPEFFREEYCKQMENYLAAVRKICRKLKVTYQMLETTTPFDRAIRTFLETRMKMD